MTDNLTPQMRDTWILAEKIQRWISKQDYCGEELLHASVCCDHVGRMRFIGAIEKIIIDSLTVEDECEEHIFKDYICIVCGYKYEWRNKYHIGEKPLTVEDDWREKCKKLVDEYIKQTTNYDNQIALRKIGEYLAYLRDEKGVMITPEEDAIYIRAFRDWLLSGNIISKPLTGGMK